MKNCLKDVDWKKVGTFAGGVLFGTAGIRILSSKDAKKVYTNCTAAVLRAKKCVMAGANPIQENCGDIYADAKDINEKREAAADELFFEDASEDASTDVKASDSTVTE